MALFLQVSSSLAPMQYTDVCRIAQLPNRGWLLDFGREVFFPRHTCSVERTEYLMGFILLDYIYLHMLLLCYIAIYLYNYIVIALFIYCVVCFSIACLQHGGITFFISIFYFCSLLRPLFFMIVVAVSLYHLAFYRAKVWRFCQIPKTRRCLILLKLFRNAFHKCCTFGFSKKLSTELFGVLTPRNHHLLMHVKRLYDDEMTE